MSGRSYSFIQDYTLKGYVIADDDSDATPNFYGYVRQDGSWYILKETLAAGANVYEYARGPAGYTANFTNRAGLTYARFHLVDWEGA